MKVSGLLVNFILSAFGTASVNYYKLYGAFLQHDPKLVLEMCSNWSSRRENVGFWLEDF